MPHLYFFLFFLFAACLPLKAIAQDDAAFTPPDTIVATLPAPPISTYLPGAYNNFYPDYADRFWELHKGVNAQISAFASFGNHRSQSVSLGYAAPIGKHFTVAGSVFLTHYQMGASHNADVSASASVSYKPNDRLTLYAWIQKSFTPHRPLMPPPAWTYYLDTPRDAVGFAAEYRIGESAWLSVCFEAARYEDHSPFGAPSYAIPNHPGWHH